MFKFKLNKRKLLFTITTILVASLCFNVIILHNTNILQTNYDYIKTINVSAGDSELISFVNTLNVVDLDTNNVEIFDITRGEVVKTVKLDPKIEVEGINCLKNISGMYPKVIAIPKNGYIIRIPYTNSPIIKNSWLNDYGINSVTEEFIIFPKNDTPFLLIFDKKNRPFFYNFNYKTTALQEELNFNLTQ